MKSFHKQTLQETCICACCALPSNHALMLFGCHPTFHARSASELNSYRRAAFPASLYPPARRRPCNLRRLRPTHGLVVLLCLFVLVRELTSRLRNILPVCNPVHQDKYRPNPSQYLHNLRLDYFFIIYLLDIIPMSFTFHLQKINESFDRIALWYREFMHRTELCFRALHERVMRLEDQQAMQRPSDEQVERVLRKILAERFSERDVLSVQNPHMMKEEDYFVEDRRGRTLPKPVRIDAASLFVNPESVPSKAYTDTFEMLDRGLADFPDLESKRFHVQKT
ncbi:hypothetical protein HBI30_005490 [Parastagonospora nodorum]|nr:hypothetical protein HBI30_005490 [Parastagonospora nodorum]